LAALKMAGAAPPATIVCLARRSMGETRFVDRAELQRQQTIEIERGIDARHALGYSNACWIGKVIEGGQSWASIAPSANSTRQCTMLCGCSTA